VTTGRLLGLDLRTVDASLYLVGMAVIMNAPRGHRSAAQRGIAAAAAAGADQVVRGGVQVDGDRLSVDAEADQDHGAGRASSCSRMPGRR
jgi:hypothetical protein